ncbi:MAG: class I SAM-dependent methyltransferase [Nakamurella sp.]
MTESRYTHGYDESVLRSHTWRTVDNSAAYLAPHLRPGLSLLDVGCGPGTITSEFAHRLAPGRVVAIDPSAEVLSAARVVAENAGATIHFVQADIYDDVHAWAPGGERFDIVHAHQVLQHVPDPVTALRAMRATCAPGGLVAARDADYAGFFWYPRIPELDEWLELYRAVARGNGGEPNAARHMLAWARAAGFTEISVIPEIWCFATDAERRWWGSLWADRTRKSAVAKAALERGLATTADLERIAAGWETWSSEADGTFVVPHVAILCRNTP